MNVKFTKGPSNSDRRNINAKITGATDKELERIAILIERRAKVSMKAGGGKERIPSPPGTPPHVQTGTLRSSISFAKNAAGSYIIGPTAIASYGEKHEFGQGLPARPFMRPAAESVISSAIGKMRGRK